MTGVRWISGAIRVAACRISATVTVVDGMAFLTMMDRSCTQYTESYQARHLLRPDEPEK